jgi:hypothetical protein
MNNDFIIPANTDEYQHYLCETIIRYLYGDAEVEKYKAYHDKNKAYNRLKGVYIDQFDYTTDKHIQKNEVEYADKVADALRHAKFHAKYGDLHMHDEGDSLFKAVIESKAYKDLGYKRSILCIYPK